MNREAYLNELVDGMFGDKRPDEIAPCPFTDTEIAELESSDELLVYVPAGLSARELCELFDIRANIDFDVEANMIRTVMVSESHWFVTSAAKVPELIGSSGKYAKREYDDEGLHGLDLRRYLRFCAAFKARNGVFPDRTYWTFLLSGSYDRSGISIVGFDAWEICRITAGCGISRRSSAAHATRCWRRASNSFHKPSTCHAPAGVCTANMAATKQGWIGAGDGQCIRRVASSAR